MRIVLLLLTLVSLAQGQISSGSIMAASSKETAAGTLWMIQWGTTTYSAMAPSAWNVGVETPMIFRVWHRFTCPSRQAGH